MNLEDLEQLAEHLDELDNQLESLCAQGQYLWFRRSDNTFHSTTVRLPPYEGCMYLLNASPEWRAQWDDWAAAGDDLMDSLIESIDQVRAAS